MQETPAARRREVGVSLCGEGRPVEPPPHVCSSGLLDSWHYIDVGLGWSGHAGMDCKSRVRRLIVARLLEIDLRAVRGIVHERVDPARSDIGRCIDA